MLSDFFNQVSQLPIYRYGWTLFSILVILPAIVSGNMLQHHLTQWVKRKSTLRDCGKPLLLNLVILVACVSIAFYGLIFL